MNDQIMFMGRCVLSIIFAISAVYLIIKGEEKGWGWLLLLAFWVLL
jgi:hypothetical protein